MLTADRLLPLYAAGGAISLLRGLIGMIKEQRHD
jgi:hypothetical protein